MDAGSDEEIDVCATTGVLACEEAVAELTIDTAGLAYHDCTPW